MIYQGKARHPVYEVCLHTAAVPGGWHEGKSTAQIVAEIDRWHKDRGWRGIGYHRVFAPDGEIGIGRSIYDVGAGVKGRNRGIIHLCMINVNTHKGVTRFEDYFTEKQRAAVKSYIAEVAALTDLKRVTGHNDFAAKECPGFKVQSGDWMPA